MTTATGGSILQHATLRIDTQQPTQFIDITDELETLITTAGIRTGLLNVHGLHTTTAVVINEHEPLLLADLAGLLDRLAPQSASYGHDDTSRRTVNCVPGERPNGHSHCRALLLTPGVCLNIADGRLRLGRWQRVFVVELDGPRCRELSAVLVGGAEQ